MTYDPYVFWRRRCLQAEADADVLAEAVLEGGSAPIHALEAVERAIARRLVTEPVNKPAPSVEDLESEYMKGLEWL